MKKRERMFHSILTHRLPRMDDTMTIGEIEESDNNIITQIIIELTSSEHPDKMNRIRREIYRDDIKPIYDTYFKPTNGYSGIERLDLYNKKLGLTILQ